jgi:nucleoside-diphosphate-sugar epimerase
MAADNGASAGHTGAMNSTHHPPGAVPHPSSSAATALALPTVLVLGANGRLGRAAALAFAQAGWRVLAQVRSAAHGLPRGVEALPVPLQDTAELVAQASGATAVVYAVNPVYTDWASKMLPLAQQGLDVAERLGALFVLPGNVYAYGEAMPALLSEDTPERPSTEKGRLRQQLEADIRRRAKAGRLKAVVLRAGFGHRQGHPQGASGQPRACAAAARLGVSAGLCPHPRGGGRTPPRHT